MTEMNKNNEQDLNMEELEQVNGGFGDPGEEMQEIVQQAIETIVAFTA